jgi:hypothetical protein
MESPPPVPPLKVFSVTFRPGRPRKGTARAQWEETEEGITLPWSIKRRRY